MLATLEKIIEAARSQRDVLAFLGVVAAAAVLLTQGVGILETLTFAMFLLGGWVVVRWGLVKIHAKERLQQFRQDARLASLKVLAERGTKADIRQMIEDMSKEDRPE